MPHYKDVNTFKYDTTAITGVMSVTIGGGGVVASSMSDGGTFTHFVQKAPVTFSVVLNDEKEAQKLAKKTADTKNITFDVKDQADDDAGTVTLTNAKTGGVEGGYGPGGQTWTVKGACDSASDPTV